MAHTIWMKKKRKKTGINLVYFCCFWLVTYCDGRCRRSGSCDTMSLCQCAHIRLSNEFTIQIIQSRTLTITQRLLLIQLFMNFWFSFVARVNSIESSTKEIWLKWFNTIMFCSIKVLFGNFYSPFFFSFIFLDGILFQSWVICFVWKSRRTKDKWISFPSKYERTNDYEKCLKKTL